MAIKLFVECRRSHHGPALPLAERLAVRDGQIAAIGSTDEPLSLREGESQVVDLEGRPFAPDHQLNHVERRHRKS